MYSPDTCPAARAQEGRAINAPARSKDDAAPFTFIVATSLDWLKDLLQPQNHFPTTTFCIQIRIFYFNDSGMCKIQRQLTKWFRSTNVPDGTSPCWQSFHRVLSGTAFARTRRARQASTQLSLPAR